MNATPHPHYAGESFHSENASNCFLASEGKVISKLFTNWGG